MLLFRLPPFRYIAPCLTAQLVFGCAGPTVTERETPSFAAPVEAAAPRSAGPANAETANAATASASTPIASPPTVQPAETTADVVPVDEGDLALASVQMIRTIVVSGGSRTSPYVSEKRSAAVGACFAEIPLAARSRQDPHEVTLIWPNSGYRSGGVNFGRSGRGAGKGNQTPHEDAFTACVTAAIPKETVSSMDREYESIKAIQVTVRVYTEAAAERHLVNEVFHGSGTRGFRNRSRPR